MNMNNIKHLLNQYMSTGEAASSGGNNAPDMGDTLKKFGNNLPGGLAGGAAAGGLMALLMGNKSARKFAGKAATYGGAALIGGLAYKAYTNWQYNQSNPPTARSGTWNDMLEQSNAAAPVDTAGPGFQLQLIKSMIAAAKADGHIDATEQQRIFKAVDEMEVSTELKGVIFDLLQQPISVEEVAAGVVSIEQKAEIYLAACLVIDPDHPSEVAHLEQLASALELPEGLGEQLQLQAQRAVAAAA